MISKEIFAVDEGVIQILQYDPLSYVKSCLDRWIVGEDPNKLALFLSKLIYLTDTPTHEIIQGESGVGKTYLALGVLDAFPEEDVIKLSRITGTWTDYSRDRLKHKIILLQQLGGLSSTTDTFHIMMSERGLSLGTVRREGGAWVSQRIEAEGPISLTSTTTSLNIDSQMETRTIIITPDESSEQTEAIQKQQAYLDAYPWESRQRRVSIKEMQNVVRHLRDHGIKDVVVPYSKLIMLPNDVIRTRRDRFKIMALIKSLVMLRQMSRMIF